MLALEKGVLALEAGAIGRRACLRQREGRGWKPGVPALEKSVLALERGALLPGGVFVAEKGVVGFETPVLRREWRKRRGFCLRGYVLPLAFRRACRIHTSAPLAEYVAGPASSRTSVVSTGARRRGSSTHSSFELNNANPR